MQECQGGVAAGCGKPLLEVFPSFVRRGLRGGRNIRKA
jgi:hypothetical protein